MSRPLPPPASAAMRAASIRAASPRTTRRPMARKDRSQRSAATSSSSSVKPGGNAGFEREAAQDAAAEGVDGLDAQAAGRLERFREQFARAADVVRRRTSESIAAFEFGESLRAAGPRP